MSLVIAAISKDNDIIVCGEGRTVDAITDEVYKENTRKAFKFNDSLIVAYVGNDTKTIPLRAHMNVVHVNYKEWNVNSIYEDILKYEKENYKKEKGELQFLAAGYDDNGTPHLYVISADETACADSDFAPKRTISIGDMDCKLNFDKENDNLETIKLKIIETIKERAKINPLINDVITANENISRLSR